MAPDPVIPDVPAAVRRAQAGDLAAFEALYRTHVGRIHALARRMCRDEVAAEEATQEVFVRAWEHLGSFRGEAAFSSWLHRLAVNVLLGDRRSEGRRLARVEPVAEVEAVPRPARAGTEGAWLDLERAVEALPDRARQVFVLHDVEGWPHEEVAHAMGTTVGTSKGQLHRARELLRRALG